MSLENAASPNALHSLADRLGVQRDYVAASGEKRTVADPSIHALCAALGFQAESDIATQASLARLQASLPRLDPVLVAGPKGTLEAAWRGAKADGAAFDWQITLEGGGAARGQ